MVLDLRPIGGEAWLEVAVSTKEDTDPTSGPRSLEWESKQPALKSSAGSGVSGDMQVWGKATRVRKGSSA